MSRYFKPTKSLISDFRVGLWGAGFFLIFITAASLNDQYLLQSWRWVYVLTFATICSGTMLLFSRNNLFLKEAAWGLISAIVIGLAAYLAYSWVLSSAISQF